MAINSVSRIRSSAKYRLSSYAERLIAPWLRLRHWQPSGFHPLTGVELGASYGYEEEAQIKNAVARVVGSTQLSFPRLASLWLQVRYLDKMKIPGALVECGVWKGGASAVMAQAHLAGGSAPHRDLHMFDSWQGMPEPDGTMDGAIAIEFAGGKAGGSLTPIGVNLSEEGEARALVVDIVGYPAQLTHLHPGWFQDTVPRDADSIGPIALLRLDGDWYHSTKVCLEGLYPSVVKYGSVVVDDYGHFEGCRKAVDEFVADLPYPVMLHHVDYTGRYWIKTE